MSQAKKGGLGRGLAALIPTGPTEVQGLGSAAANAVIGLDPIGPHPAEAYLHRVPDPVPGSDAGATYREIPAEQIQPNPKQPRQVFEQEALDELIHSIREFGLMQPIVVRALSGVTAIGADSPVQYQIVMGERRWRACQEAGLTAVPAIVRETTDDAMLRDALLENIHRVQLNPLEEAAAYQQLLEEFDVTHEELANRIGRSRPVVTNMIRLLKLPIPVQRRVAAGVSRPGTLAPCWVWTPAPRRRSGLPSESSPRACRSAPRRKRSRSRTGIRSRSVSRGRSASPSMPRGWIVWPSGWRIRSTPVSP